MFLNLRFASSLYLYARSSHPFLPPHALRLGLPTVAIIVTTLAKLKMQEYEILT